MSGEHETVSIVCGGWSFSLVDPMKLPGYIIAVNDSSVNLSLLGVEPDEVVSMDRLWTEHRWPYLCEREDTTYLRDSAAKGVAYKGKDWCHIFQNQRGSRVAFAPGEQWLNGNHSAYCALNRAYQLKPRTLLLFGLDFQMGPHGQRHWYGYQGVGPQDGNSSGYNFLQWAGEMALAKVEFDRVKVTVINVSKRSIITAFKKADPVALGLDRKVAV